MKIFNEIFLKMVVCISFDECKRWKECEKMAMHLRCV